MATGICPFCASHASAASSGRRDTNSVLSRALDIEAHLVGKRQHLLGLIAALRKRGAANAQRDIARLIFPGDRDVRDREADSLRRTSRVFGPGLRQENGELIAAGLQVVLQQNLVRWLLPDQQKVWPLLLNTPLVCEQSNKQ